MQVANQCFSALFTPPYAFCNNQRVGGYGFGNGNVSIAVATFCAVRATRFKLSADPDPKPAEHGSAWGPVILPVFKTGVRQVCLSKVRSTRTRFRQTRISGGLKRTR
jgi:hypothetical protein